MHKGQKKLAMIVCLEDLQDLFGLPEGVEISQVHFNVDYQRLELVLVGDGLPDNCPLHAPGCVLNHYRAKLVKRTVCEGLDGW